MSTILNMIGALVLGFLVGTARAWHLAESAAEKANMLRVWRTW